MDALGRHLLIELWDCNGRINDRVAVETAIVEAVAAIGATIVNLHVHAFSPQGVTGLAVLAESHLSLHSWPEHAYLAADVYTCGKTTQPENAVDVLARWFEPQHIDVQEVARGLRPCANEVD